MWADDLAFAATGPGDWVCIAGEKRFYENMRGRVPVKLIGREGY
jgi:hypothetical protein